MFQWFTYVLWCLLCFHRTLKRPGQAPEKVNRGMILAPLVGIILNLLDASLVTDSRKQNDIVSVFASMDCADTLISGFQYLLEFNWVSNHDSQLHLTRDYKMGGSGGLGNGSKQVNLLCWSKQAWPGWVDPNTVCSNCFCSFQMIDVLNIINKNNCYYSNNLIFRIVECMH